MEPKIDTLVEDIYRVVETKGGWSAALSSYLSGRLTSTIEERLSPSTKSHKAGTLRLSSASQPCTRKLWYEVNLPKGSGQPFEPNMHILFLYGDILEDLILALAKAAGHKVEGEQDVMYLAGIKGHRDCVIDGVLIDVKSTSPYSFKKFKDNGLWGNDPFGYIGQVTSYLAASAEDPLVKDKNNTGFLAINKVTGELALDIYDLSREIKAQEAFLEERKEIVKGTTVPPREYSTESDGKSGNRKLCYECSTCPFKATCYPELRTFKSFRGNVYLTKVVREPKMQEIK